MKGAVIEGTDAPALVKRCMQLSGKALVKLEPLRDSCCVNLAHVYPGHQLIATRIFLVMGSGFWPVLLGF